MTHYMIGKVLQGRYQVVQNLGTGVFGQTYIAIDTESPDNPKSVVKQLKVTSSEPSYLQTLRLYFLAETETLKNLGHHDQIPQLIACFEENERFYLVQEFIEGHALTEELPTKENLKYLWTETEVVCFLKDVLGILKFVHSQGVIHCDVKPENLIRRACDGKLVLIDFGSIQPVDFRLDDVLPIYRIPATSLGYIPPEQFIGQTQPNSDIYALGMFAIQALTGLTPLQLKIEPHSNQIIWRSSNTAVSDGLAAILSQMVCYDFKERFQSTDEVLLALLEMPKEREKQQTLEANYTRLSDSVEVDQSQGEKGAKSPLLTGMKVGLAANSLLLGFGVYSLLNNSPAYSETETLYKATEEFQSGDLAKAIALAKSIPTTSNVYPDAQNTIEEWQNQWGTAVEQYQLAEKAFNEGRWSDVLHAATRVPDILYWQSKITHLVHHAQANIEVQTNDLLAKAYEKATEQDFTKAIEYLRQIPQETSIGTIVQQKLAEYNQKRHIRAAYFLQQAYNQAAKNDFDSAVKSLQRVPKDTPVYETAQVKLIEYTYKQRQQAEKPKMETSIQKITQRLIKKSSSMSIQSFEPGNELQEVNIK
ncbi:MAG: serine/threonine protein kinase [Stigonema ocellatum SAG 48.90 = DSM 106950]|nr:serine/threonine protein kinase [Stigonema ocellatum SAG 48.90 = DSM 106950]